MQQALSNSERSLVRFCQDFNFYRRLAEIYRNNRLYSKALIFIRRAIILDDSHPESLMCRAAIYGELGELEQSKRDLLYLLRHTPNNSDILIMLAAIYQKNAELAAAQIVIDKYVILNPGRELAWFNRGANQFHGGAVGLASKSFSRTLNICPEHLKSRWHLGLIALADGQFTLGWKDYELRFKISPDLYLFEENDLSGDLSAETVLVWAEQGIGDEVLFGSLLEEFSQSVKKLLVQLDKRLIPLFRRSLPSGIELYDRRDSLPPSGYTRHVAIGSLAKILRPTRESFTGHGYKYLHADPIRINRYARYIVKQPNERIIGLSWRSANSQTGVAKSVPLSDLILAFMAPGIRFISLQYRDNDQEIAAVANQLGVAIWQCPDLDTTNDLDGLAALIECCDEVVSISNATAHIAGALGKKTTVVLTYVPNWRWMSTGDTTPWYRSVNVRRIGHSLLAGPYGAS